jgi:hypothetical protein
LQLVETRRTVSGFAVVDVPTAVVVHGNVQTELLGVFSRVSSGATAVCAGRLGVASSEEEGKNGENGGSCEGEFHRAVFFSVGVRVGVQTSAVWCCVCVLKQLQQ